MKRYFDADKLKEFVAAIQGKMNTLRGLDDFIDNLLKEMVGEKE